MSEFIEGPVTPPIEAVELKKFKSRKSLVMTWLFNSMRADIRHTFLLLDTPHQIWTTAAQTYSQQGNDAQCFELRKRLRTLEQNHRSVAVYFADLSGTWGEFDYYQGFQALDPIRVQVLGRIPFPSLGEAYSIVQQEESRRGAMLQLPTSDRSALIATPQGHFGSVSGPILQGGKSQSGTIIGPPDRASLQCDYCHNTGHIRDFCWKLHGKPSRGRGDGRGGHGRDPVRSRAQAHVSESTVGTLPDSGFSTGIQASSDHVGGFSQGEIQTLKRLMAQVDSPSTIASSSTAAPTSSYFAHIGIPINAFTASSAIPWIIDSGASDHMTGCSSVFDSYSTCSGKDKVRIADGSFSAISGKGSIRYSPSISLSSVLHIPNFATNLMSELDTGKVIGSGKSHGGLYFLESAPRSPMSCGLALQADTSPALTMLHQWHLLMSPLSHRGCLVVCVLFMPLIPLGAS
ncbi:uncharacterized protein LOC131313906 [Rhododendron vialii]|uniref:uncharacterized protein LOC131313906 n=1 Tax=Rhododendron vialii TaxID=182163 RepID=UPI00265E4DE4|nr:uncharacterized protein LOC131313906 [Rhododendron vialii]